jgi:hypothetical protein
MSVTVQVDTSALEDTIRRINNVQRVTQAAITVSLNEVGDGLVAVLATSIAKDTGLEIEQVRGLMSVHRATRGNPNYEISIDPNLTKTGARGVEGGRESKDFGKHQPGALVIVVSRQDELVCMDCEELAAAGPMPIEVAMEHVPKHPHCRCVIMPYVQKGKRLPLTMTSTSGTSAQQRMGGTGQMDERQTLRQLAQKILDRTARDIKIELG